VALHQRVPAASTPTATQSLACGLGAQLGQWGDLVPDRSGTAATWESVDDMQQARSLRQTVDRLQQVSSSIS
jgi:hypothetical protein